MNAVENPTPSEQAVVATKQSLLAQSPLRKLCFAFIGLGFLLTFLESTTGLGFLLSLAGLMLLINVSFVPRLIIGVLGAGLIGMPGASLQSKVAESAKSAAAEQQLAQQKDSINSAIASGDWERANTLIFQLRSTNPGVPEIEDYAARVDPEMKRITARKQEEGRRKAVEAGVRAAKSVVTNNASCETPKDISDAWNQLKLAKASDAEWAEARQLAVGLESCRRRSEASASRGLQQLMIAQREQWAQRGETSMLDQGMDVTIRLSGAAKTSVTLSWALMGRPLVHKITDGGSMAEGAFLANLQKIGFKRVTFSDGYDYNVYYTLNPDDEAGAGSTVMAGLGLGSPLILR